MFSATDIDNDNDNNDNDNNDNDNSLLENSTQHFYNGSSNALWYVLVT